jgi:hypothetical protein
MDRESRDSMEDIHLRILRVTDDLGVIQRELNCAAMQAPTDPELMEALADPPEMESIQALKAALDQMRHFLCARMGLLRSPKWSSNFRTRPTRSCSAILPRASSASPIKLS